MIISKEEKITHVSLTIEGARPRFQVRVDEMRESIARVLKVPLEGVGMTVTSGDGLTSFGKGEGLQCFAIITVQ